MLAMLGSLSVTTDLYIEHNYAGCLATDPVDLVLSGVYIRKFFYVIVALRSAHAA